MPFSRVRTLVLVLVPILGFAIAKFKDSNTTLAIAGVSLLVVIAVWQQWRKTKNAIQVLVAELHEDLTKIVGPENEHKTEIAPSFRCALYLYRSGKLYEDAHYPYIYPHPPTKVCQGIVGRCFRTELSGYRSEIPDAKTFFVESGYTSEQSGELPLDIKTYMCHPVRDPKVMRPTGVILAYSTSVHVSFTPECRSVLARYAQKSREKLVSTEF